MTENTNKDKFVDLHMHTFYSDGTEDPKSLVRAQRFSGVDTIAITDHDTMKGYFAAIDEAKRYGLELIPGVEVSTEVYHILGLNVDPQDTEFQSFLSYVRDIQADTCAQRIDKLAKNGVPITLGKLKEQFPESRLGKYNIFMTMMIDQACRNYLESRHPDKNIVDTFQDYLGKNGVAGKVDFKRYVTSKETIDAIHKAGGIAVIAHPFKEIKTDIEKSLDKLVEEGIDGLEIQPNFGDKNDKFREYALRKGLPMTYGSDYHGAGFPRKLIGKGENKIADLNELLNLRKVHYTKQQ